jgi:3-oxoadipate enol-lactonase
MKAPQHESALGSDFADPCCDGKCYGRNLIAIAWSESAGICPQEFRGEEQLMPVFRNGNETLSYDDTGSGGPVLVFNHSFAMNGSMFAPQCDAFRDRYRCITWDQRGHGCSPTDLDFTFWDSAGDCLALLDHLDIQKASFVGASQGGFVSLRLALLAPDRVRSLVVLGSSASAEAEDRKKSYLQMNAAFAAAGGSGPPEEILNAMSYVCFGSKFDASPWKEIWRRWPARQATLALRALVETELGRHMKPDELGKRVAQINAQLAADGQPPFQWKTIPQGAATSVWATFVALAEDVGGRYCENYRVSTVTEGLISPVSEGVRPYALDPEHAKALWAKSEEMVGEHF